MAFTIPSLPNFPTKNQIPDHSIMDYYNKQLYLGNQFMTGPDKLTLADTAEHPLLLVQNAVTSAKSLFILNFVLGAQGSTDAITYRIYGNPTFSAAGTGLTPINLRVANTTASLATITNSPTVSANGTRWMTYVAGFGTQIVSMPMRIIDPGQTMLITGQGAAAATAICQIVHYEL